MCKLGPSLCPKCNIMPEAICCYLQTFNYNIDVHLSEKNLYLCSYYNILPEAICCYL